MGWNRVTVVGQEALTMAEDEKFWATQTGTPIGTKTTAREAALTPWKEYEPTGTSQVVSTSTQAAGASEVTVVLKAVAFVAAAAAAAMAL